jgi:hypothetical protein
MYERVLSDPEDLATDDRIHVHYTKAGGNVRVSAGLNNYLSDQPENRKLTGFGGRNANHSGQYGKSLQAKLTFKFMIACRNCVCDMREDKLKNN